VSRLDLINYRNAPSAKMPVHALPAGVHRSSQYAEGVVVRLKVTARHLKRNCTEHVILRRSRRRRAVAALRA